MDMETVKFFAWLVGSICGGLGMIAMALIRLYTYRATMSVQSAILKIVERNYQSRDVAKAQYRDLSNQIQQLREIINHA